MLRKLLTPPAAEPFTLDEVKRHLRVEIDEDNDLISSYLTSARQTVEETTRRALISQTWEFQFDGWPEGDEIFRIPFPPLGSVTKIEYLDEAGDLQTLAGSAYVVDVPAGPTADYATIRLASGEEWPVVYDEPNSVRVTAVVGYGAAGSSVPGPIKTSILLLVGGFYANREEVVTGTIATKLPRTIESLLAPYRVFRFA